MPLDPVGFNAGLGRKPGVLSDGLGIAPTSRDGR